PIPYLNLFTMPCSSTTPATTDTSPLSLHDALPISYGYLKAEEITFTVEDTAQIQKVEMKDDVPTGTLIINKKGEFLEDVTLADTDRKSTRLNSSHVSISYAVFCLKKKRKTASCRDR